MGVEQPEDLEALFNEGIKDAVEQAKAFNEVDVVIGIPFCDEKGILAEVLNVLDEGLAGIPDVRRPLIVCVGDPAGAETLERIRGLDLKAPHLAFLMKPGTDGRGSGIRAILAIADRIEADAVILAADLGREEGRGLQPDWIRRLMKPIREEYDFVVASFQRPGFENLLESLFMAPLLEVFYGYNLMGSLSGVYAISHDTVADFCADIKFWTDTAHGFGIDPWLVSRAMRWNKNICEVELGVRREEIFLEKLRSNFKESARALFTCIKRDEDRWIGSRFIIRTPDIYGSKTGDGSPKPSPGRDVTLFRESYAQGKSVYDSAYQDYLYEGNGDIEPGLDKDIGIEGKTWSGIVYRVLFKYWFVPGVYRDDLLGALTFAFIGRVASFIEHIQSLEEQLEGIKNVDISSIVSNEVVSAKEEQKQDFLRLREQFVLLWEQKALEIKPPLTPADYLEFVPGVPTVLPKRIEGRQGRVVSAEEMFSRLQSRYQEAFSRFVRDGLETSESAGSAAIIQSMKEFMSKLEETMEWLLPGNLYTEEGTRETVDRLFRIFQCSAILSIKDEVFREMLLRFPPVNVMIRAGCKTPRELLRKMDVRDAVSLANLVETRKYGDRALSWTLDNLRPDGMGEVEIRPIILDEKVLDGTVKLGNISDFNKLAARIVLAPLQKGMGGDYPKLRFALFVARHIMIAHNYDVLWRTYARERKNLGGKISNSLVGPYPRTIYLKTSTTGRWSASSGRWQGAWRPPATTSGPG